MELHDTRDQASDIHVNSSQYSLYNIIINLNKLCIIFALCRLSQTSLLR